MANNIEDKIDKAITGEIIISRAAGGVDIQKLGEMMEVAKLMSISETMVPAFLRKNPGACLGICWKAIGWGMDPFAVAQMAYEVENSKTKEKTVAFMSQLVHAVIESRAPIRQRLAVRYEGEGDDRVCIVSGIFRNETNPREWRSPRLGDRRPKTKTRTNSQTGETYETSSGSPLWQTKPDQQQFYDTSRDWARVYCPDVLMGIYTSEELQEHGFEPQVGGYRSPDDDGGLQKRITSSAAQRMGFAAPETSLSAEHVEREVADAMAARHAQAAAEPPPPAEPPTEWDSGDLGPDPGIASQTRSRPRQRRAGPPASHQGESA